MIFYLVLDFIIDISEENCKMGSKEIGICYGINAVIVAENEDNQNNM